MLSSKFAAKDRLFAVDDFSKKVPLMVNSDKDLTYSYLLVPMFFVYVLMTYPCK